MTDGKNHMALLFFCSKITTLMHREEGEKAQQKGSSSKTAPVCLFQNKLVKKKKN